MLAITTDSFKGYGLDQTFALAAEAGLDGIEVVIEHGAYDTQDAEYLKRLSRRHKLPIVALSTSASMSAEKAERVVNLAIAIGTPLVSIVPPDIFDFDYKRWVKKESQLIRKKKKVIIALVNPPVKTVFGILPKYAFNDIYQLKKFSDLTFDTSNTTGKSEPLLEIYSVLRSVIRSVHLGNAKIDRDHTLLADGNLPLESFLTRLARDKFTGAITLKLNPKALGVGKAFKVVGNIKNCRSFIEKFFQAS